jgi:anhydro-N-acetylmuramic acid kinase
MKTIFAIGLMSGTSLDGLDICYVQFTYPSMDFNILSAQTLDYSDEWKFRLKNSIHLSGEELTKLDVDYGFLLGEMVSEFIQNHCIQNLDFIASHGHTVFHNPKEFYTLQIGNGRCIYAKTGIKTIFDFRTQDVILGGQGAPLVPIGDELLFGGFDACLNLGGFSNISFRKEQKRIAFDICPVNIILNHLAEKIGFKYDANGEIARNGRISDELVRELNQLEFYQQNPPKSLGIEWCLEKIHPILNQSNLSTEDLIASFTEHISIQITEIFNQNEIKNCLVTGGGANNQFLIESIQMRTSTEIILPEPQIIEFKEALIFALMGMLKLENQINIFQSVTGATQNHSAGLIIS